jgi:hypothetical protein
VIQKDLLEIKEWYKVNKTSRMSSLGRDRKRMFQLRPTVEDMEDEVKHPMDPIVIGGTGKRDFGPISFETGEYEINKQGQEKALMEVIWYINKKTATYKRDEPNRKVKLNVRIVGYADEQPVLGKLASFLWKDVPVTERTRHRQGERQFLNKILSGKRAVTVKNYILKHWTPDLLVSVVPKSDEMGEELPKYKGMVTERCPDDCPARRVVLVTVAPYSESQ